MDRDSPAVTRVRVAWEMVHDTFQPTQDRNILQNSSATGNKNTSSPRTPAQKFLELMIKVTFIYLLSLFCTNRMEEVEVLPYLTSNLGEGVLAKQASHFLLSRSLQGPASP